MVKVKKLYKKYERYVLIGLVVLLLATFSIGGALTSCQEEQRSVIKLGGTFEPAPGEQASLSDAEFDEAHQKYATGQRALQMPSLEFRDLIMQGRGSAPDPRHATWMHILATRAAQKAGYGVGESQLNKAILDLVGRRMRNAGLPNSNAAYQEFLRTEYRGTQTEFETMVRDILKKDEFLAPLVHTAVYDLTYGEAYKEWKNRRERVDLEYVSLPAEPFADVVREAEFTRKQISKQAMLLDQLTKTSRTVRSLVSRAENAKSAKKAYPKDMEELAAGLRGLVDQKDAWGNAYRYQVTDGVLDVRSAGPDGEMDTSDDVSDGTRRTVQSHGAVQFVADAVMQWKSATDKWPTALTDLLKGPSEGTLPPVKNADQLKDGWDRDLVLEANADAAPRLYSLGADATAGTDDDIHASFEDERARVTASPALSPFMLEDLRDSWNNPLQVGINNPTLWLWSVKSPGEDGSFGSEDDLDTGNAGAIADFFAKNRPEFRQPTRRTFETIYVLLPLLSDAVLGELWKAYPQHHPESEKVVFDHWQLYRGEGLPYQAEDPADPESGHGAKAMKKLAPDRTPNLVPGKDVFPALDAPAKDDDPKEDEPKGDEPKDDEPKDDGEQLPPAPDRDEELRQIYDDAGWRSVVIRDMFVEGILNDVLRRARASETAIRVWESEFGSIEKDDDAKDDDAKDDDAKDDDAEEDGKDDDAKDDDAEDDDGKDDDAKDDDAEDDDGKDDDAKDDDAKDDDAKDDDAKDDEEDPLPARPQEVTFRELLEAELKPFLSDGEPVFVYWGAEAPMTEEEWRKDPVLNDVQLRMDLNRVTEPGRYANIPTQMHGMTVKAIVRNIELLPSRQPALEEVEDDVYEAFLLSRQMDYALEALRELQDAAERPAATDEGEDDEARRRSRWPTVLAAWREDHPEALVERTGMFIGSRPPSPVRFDEVDGDDQADGDDEADEDPEVAGAQRRNFVWRRGYSTVEPSRSKQDELVATPGVFGRLILTDRGNTERVFLIRVAEQGFPTPAEFSPRRYAEFMRERTYGPMGMPMQGRRLRDRPGSLTQALARYIDDIEFMRAVFKLQTTTNLDLLHVP